MALVYDSGAVSGLSAANPVTVNHNLGYIPSVYSVQAAAEEGYTGWALMDPENPTGPAGVYVDSFDANSAVVKMREGYAYTGDFALVCYHG